MPKRRWLSSRQSIVLWAAIICVFGWYAYHELSRLRAEVFDAAAWQDSTPSGEARRLAMADGLVARGDLIGKTRSEVVGMLGGPPPPEYFRDWDMVYRLGMERGFFSIDSEWLVVRLADDGRVVDCRIVRD